jgi:hypothetical protein
MGLRLNYLVPSTSERPRASQFEETVGRFVGLEQPLDPLA